MFTKILKDDNMGKDNVSYLAQKKDDYNKYGKNKKNRKKGIYLFFFICLLVFFSLAYYYLTINRIVLVTADYNEIVDGFSTKGLLLRDEKKYYADQAGILLLLKEEGERVGYGEDIIKINNDILYNYNPGLVSYAIDDLEEELTLKNIDSINVSNFSNYKRKYKQLLNNDHIEKGQAVFRIINNDSFYIVIKTNLKETQRYRDNEEVFIKPDFVRNRIIEANIIRKVSEGNEGLLIVKVDTFLKEWLNIRRVNFTFIKNIYRGITIPRKAIFTNPNGQGVLIYQADRRYKFSKVNIVNGNDEFVVVSGIEIGQKVIINPEDVDYGRGV